MEKSIKKYWAIIDGDITVFEGSFTECWKQLMEQYGDYTCRALMRRNCRITRINS